MFPQKKRATQQRRRMFTVSPGSLRRLAQWENVIHIHRVCQDYFHPRTEHAGPRATLALNIKVREKRTLIQRGCGRQREKGQNPKVGGRVGVRSFDISSRSLLRPDLHAAVSQQDWMNEQQIMMMMMMVFFVFFSPITHHSISCGGGQFLNSYQQTLRFVIREWKHKADLYWRYKKNVFIYSFVFISKTLVLDFATSSLLLFFNHCAATHWCAVRWKVIQFHLIGLKH